MNKLILTSLGILSVHAAYAATPWWQQATVCKLDPTKCYASMGAGYDTGMWDATGKCWGLKLICGDALKTTSIDARPVSKNDIERGNVINSDFDITVLNGDCFGVRKTSNAAMASVNGKMTNVWCSGILNRPDEILDSGEISYSEVPTCATLAADGYAGILNGKCYGKYYDPSQYYIECDTSLEPTRIIVLNGADYDANARNASMESVAVSATFDQMYNLSKSQHEKYFKSK